MKPTPSNVTIKEFVSYYLKSAPTEEIEDKFISLVAELETLKMIVASSDETEEMLREQLDFARELVGNINSEATRVAKISRLNSAGRDFSTFCLTAIEDSYFEI